MDWLRQVLNQAAAAFKAMTAAQRASMIMLGLTIVVALGMVTVLGARPKYVTLASGLDQTELGEVARFLDERGEEYKTDLQKGAVLVPQDRKPSLIRQVTERSIISKEKVYDWESYIAGDNLTISERERARRALVAQAGELQRMIASLDGIESSNVKIQPETENEFTLNPGKVGVAVTVTSRSGRPLNQQVANSIIDLVGSAVANSDAQQITVVDTRSPGRVFKKEETDTEIFMGKNRLDLQSRVARYYQEKVEEFIAKTGYQGAVTVNCDLDLDKVREMAQELKPDEAFTVYQRTHKLDATGASLPGGAVGTMVNQPGVSPGGATVGAAGSAGTPSVSKENESETKAVCSYLTKEITRAPGKIVKLNASVIVFDRVVQKKDEKTGQVAQAFEAFPESEIGNWKKMIANALGQTIPDNIDDLKNVSVYHMKPAQLDPGAEIAAAPPTIKEMVTSYWPYARIGGLLMLTAVALFFLYGLGKRASAVPPAEVVLPSAGPGAAAGAPAATPEPEDVQFRGMQERVRALIEQDPRKVAGLVKRWLMREG